MRILFFRIGIDVISVVSATANFISNSFSRFTINQPQISTCKEDVCLTLINHHLQNKTFDIYMINHKSVAGFQCDLPGINIIGADGGLLQKNKYQTSNSADRILSFNAQGTLIHIGEGILTTVYYSNPTTEVCMTEIIFAGIGGSKLTNDEPECMKLN